MRLRLINLSLLVVALPLAFTALAPRVLAQAQPQTAPSAPMQTQQPFGADNTVTIHIRLLNGKTGQPIADKEIFLERGRNQLLSHAQERDTKTDANGLAEAVVAKDGAVLNPVVVDFRSCTLRTRHTGEADKSEQFPVAQILAHGVVAANTCGKQISAPVPGELVLYFRTRHLLERITE